jgi:hypothetical protein
MPKLQQNCHNTNFCHRFGISVVSHVSGARASENMGRGKTTWRRRRQYGDHGEICKQSLINEILVAESYWDRKTTGHYAS